MALIDLLQFRIHSVRCLTPTEHTGFDPDPDAMDLAVITIDETGDTDVSRTFDLGRFLAGTQRDFDPPLVTYQFDLNEDSSWPRTYFSEIVLAERDDWGRFDDWLRDAVRIVSEAVSSALGGLVSNLVRDALRGIVSPDLSRDAGGLSGGVTSAVVNTFLTEVFSALDTDVLNPTGTYLDLLTEDTLLPMSDTGAQARLITGQGARYMVSFSWARRLLIDSHVLDPIMTEIEVIIQTGVNDDLRAGSSASVRFVFTSSDGVSSEERFPFNHDRFEWPPNSWQLAGGSTSAKTFRLGTPRPLSTLQEIQVEYLSGRRPGLEGSFDTTDNWDMDSLVIRYHADGASGLICSERGRPLLRFSGGSAEFIARPRHSPSPDAQISLQADNGLFVVAEGGGREVAANRSSSGPWETFTMIYLGDGMVALRAHNGQYVTAEGGGGRELLANRDEIGPNENFDLLIQYDTRVALRAHNGQYVGVGGSGEVAANRDRIGPWEKFRLLIR